MSRGNTDSCCLLWCDALYSGSYLESSQWGPSSHERFPLRLLCSEWCAVIGSPFWDATAQWCVLNDCDTCQAVVFKLQQVVVCCTAHWSGAIFRFVSLICSMTPKTKNRPLCGRSVPLSEGGSVTRLRLDVPGFESRFFFPPKHPGRLWSPPSLMCYGIVVSFRGVKGAGA